MDPESDRIVTLNFHPVTPALQDKVSFTNAGVLHVDVVILARPDRENRVLPEMETFGAVGRNNLG